MDNRKDYQVTIALGHVVIRPLPRGYYAKAVYESPSARYHITARDRGDLSKKDRASVASAVLNHAVALGDRMTDVIDIAASKRIATAGSLSQTNREANRRTRYMFGDQHILSTDD